MSEASGALSPEEYVTGVENTGILESSAPVTISKSNGSVETYGGHPYSTVSETGWAIAHPVLCQHNDTITIRAQSGLYVINASAPGALALLDHDGTVLVESSYFALKSGTGDTLPSKGIIIELTSDRIVVEYDLASVDDREEAVAKMQVEADFSRLVSPKITARLVEKYVDVADWQIVWIVIPVADSRIRLPGMDDATFAIENYVGCEIPSPELVAQLVAPCASDFQVDWRDAGDGILTVKSIESGTRVACAVEVTFEKERAEIDPTLVASSTSSTPTDLACQRKVVWYGGYYWAFYDRGDTIWRSYDAAGQLLQLNSSLGNITYAYNSRGWVRQLTEVIGSNSHQARFCYDVEGKQTWVLYPSGLNVSYSYDSYDRVTTVTKLPSTSLLTITYNNDDTIASETTGETSGSLKKVTRYAYNSRDWPTGIVTKLGSTIKLVLLYSYDDVGNVKQLVVNTTSKAKDAKTETYTYDWLDRIKSASGGYLSSGLSYGYDAVGNAEEFAGKTCTYGFYNKLTSDVLCRNPLKSDILER